MCSQALNRPQCQTDSAAAHQGRMSCAGSGEKRVVRVLESGEGFGELALQTAEAKRRAATITARGDNDTELLVIHGDTYRRVIARCHQRLISARVGSCARTSATSRRHAVA